jgi:hypothetical protein
MVFGEPGNPSALGFIIGAKLKTPTNGTAHHPSINIVILLNNVY